MISISGALEALKAAFPENYPDEVFEFDENHYLITAPFHGERDFNDPFFLIDKRNGDVEQLNPFKYHQKFLKALRSQPIKKL